VKPFKRGRLGNRQDVPAARGLRDDDRPGEHPVAPNQLPARAELVDPRCSPSTLERVGLTDVADEPVDLPTGLARLVELAPRAGDRPRFSCGRAGPPVWTSTRRGWFAASCSRPGSGGGWRSSSWSTTSTSCRGYCNEVFVLDFGRRIASGPQKTVRQDPVVRTPTSAPATQTSRGARMTSWRSSSAVRCFSPCRRSPHRCPLVGPARPASRRRLGLVPDQHGGTGGPGVQDDGPEPDQPRSTCPRRPPT